MAGMRRTAVGERAGDDTARGQLLFATAIVLAVGLVALVTLTHGVVYGAADAAHGLEPTPDPLLTRGEAIDGIEASIETTNAHPQPSTQAATASVLGRIDRFDTRLARSVMTRGAVVHVETTPARVTPGWVLAVGGPNASLSNATGATRYTLAGDLERTRALTLTLTANRLAETTASRARADAFHLAFERPDATASEAVYVYRDGTGGVVVATGVVTGVTTRAANETPTVRCVIHPTATDGTVTLTLSPERLEPTRCAGERSAAPTEANAPSAITVANGDAAAGSVRAVVETSGDPTVPPAADHDGFSPGVYDVVADVRYRSPGVQFVTTVRVTPGVSHA